MKSNFKEAKSIIDRNKVKEDKPTFIDDGRSITDMNVPGFSWYMPRRYTQERQQLTDLKLTRKERLAMVFGALWAILPIAIVIMILFFGAFLLISLWLT